MKQYIEPGWYTAIPLKHHRGGRCIYCLAHFRYTEKLVYGVVPETLDHELRRLPIEEEVVYSLEGREPDFTRTPRDSESTYLVEDHGKWRNAKAQKMQTRQKMRRAKSIFNTGETP